MVEIWAKSKKSEDNKAILLCEHTKGLLEQLNIFKASVGEKVINGSDYEMLEFAIFAHDIGKVSPTFQTSVGNWNYSPKVPFPDVPHSLFSLLWIDKQRLREKVNIQDDRDLKILLSSIGFHHWRDNFELIILGKEKTFINAVKQLCEDNTLKEALLKNLKNHFQFEDFKKYADILDFDNDLAEVIQKKADIFSYVIPPYHSYFLPHRINILEKYKKKWIYTVGLLMRIDHFTSFIQEEGISEKIEKNCSNYNDVKEKIKNTISKKLDKDSIKDEEIWQINKIENRKDKNLILVAPTGSGKTEFAFLWAAGEKFFYTLPLRAAVNQIFERAEKIFGQNNTGLLHSDADVYLYEKFPEGENFRLLELARQLSLPVIISTGDQLFPSALKYPGYEKIYATLGYSRLVIDEVQAYDPRACAIIVKLIEDIVKLGGKFLLMTATLPEFIKKEIENRIGEEFFKVDIYDEHRDQYDFCKHKIRLYNADIEEKAEKIIEKAKEGKRVLVIVNTVEKAQKMYDTLVKINRNEIYLKLLHSRFTFADRKELEDEMTTEFSNPKPDKERKGKIIITTQVAEASLDIDADVLYTELAPIDSLVQRMGRVLRRIKDKNGCEKYFISGQPKEPNVFVFYQIPDKDKKLCSGAGTVYQNDLLILSLGILLDISEKKISEIWRKYKGNNIRKVVEDLINGHDNEEVPVKEPDKNEFVKKLYTTLEKLYEDFPESSNYLKKFYETLDVLDAGYMSDKKAEAQKIFREIYTVPAIPENMVEEFKKSIEDFIKDEKSPFNYTSFKMKVLSKCVVNIDVRKYLYGNNLNLKDASYLAVEIKNIDDRQMSKIKRWLTGVYIFPGKYDQNKGVIFEEKTKPRDN